MNPLYEKYLTEENQEFLSNYPDSVHRGPLDFSYQLNAYSSGWEQDPAQIDETLLLELPPIWTYQTDTGKITVTEGKVVWNHDLIYLEGINESIDVSGTPTPTDIGQSITRTGDHNNVESILDGTGGAAVVDEKEYTGSALWLIIKTDTDGKHDEAYYATATGGNTEYSRSTSTSGVYSYKLADIVTGTFTRYWRGGNWPFAGVEVDTNISGGTGGTS